MLKQTKIFIAIGSLIIGIVFVGSGLIEGMIVETLGQITQVALGVIFIGISFLIFAESRSRSLKK